MTPAETLGALGLTKYKYNPGDTPLNRQGVSTSARFTKPKAESHGDST